ncbi:glycosyltransferase family 9 protein [bacterium]|nr:glycosyltransferase family 9 protein [bacterium]
MTSFANIDPQQIKEDCRFYSGYKPCGKSDGCPDCAEYQPRGTEILIIKLGAMGDALRTKCLLPGLKRLHPQSWITWLTAPGTEPIVRDPLVDEVRALTPGGVLALEGRCFDLLLCLDKDAEAVALSRKIEATRKLGYAPTAGNQATVWNDGATYALRLGLSDDLKYRQNELTHPKILYGMAEMEYQGDEYGLEVSPAAREAAECILERGGVPKGARLIGLNTGCGPVFETKAWTQEGYAELIQRLSAQPELCMILLGGPREQELHRDLMHRAGDLAGARVFDSGNFNSLEVFFALVDECAALLSADSLAMHVGIALKKQLVAFFGPTCHQEVDLFGRGEMIVTDFQCSPCYLKRCNVRPSCMQSMDAADVEAAILRVLENA